MKTKDIYEPTPRTLGEAKHFAKWRKETTKKINKVFPNTPLVAEVNMAEGRRTYGPFNDINEVIDWIATQPTGVDIYFYHLRNPWIKRDVNDFYNPHGAELPREYDHDTKRYLGEHNE